MRPVDRLPQSFDLHAVELACFRQRPGYHTARDQRQRPIYAHELEHGLKSPRLIQATKIDGDLFYAGAGMNAPRLDRAHMAGPILSKVDGASDEDHQG